MPRKPLLEILIQKINFNSILLALIAGWFSYKSVVMENKADKTLNTQASVVVRDSSYKIEQRKWRHNTDSILNLILTNTKK
jgi:hypothetical protein